MKSVQWYLKHKNRRDLAEFYFDKYLVGSIYGYIRQKKTKFLNMTIKEYYDYAIKSIIKFIDRLCKIKPKELSKEEQMIFIAYERMPGCFGEDESYGQAYKYSEIFGNNENIETYGIICASWENVMSYLIADTDYNNEHIDEILIDILWEISFFGYENERNKKVDEILQYVDETDEEKEEEEVIKLDKNQMRNLRKLKKENLDELSKMNNDIRKKRFEFEHKSLMSHVQEIRKIKIYSNK